MKSPVPARDVKRSDGGGMGAGFGGCLIVVRAACRHTHALERAQHPLFRFERLEGRRRDQGARQEWRPVE